jgi:anti-sigma factor RsiW
MDKCLSESALIAIFTGEGSPSQRRHLDSCLTCARRYRQLGSEMRTIVSVLKQPAPREQRIRPDSTAPVWRWSLAAAAVLAAFLCGRLTIVPHGGGAALQMASQSQIEASYLDDADSIQPAAYAANMTDLLSPIDPGNDLTPGDGN